MTRLHAITPAHQVDGQPSISFCGHCGEAPASEPDPTGSRVCNHCEMGLILQAPADVAPRAGEPFLVIDTTLSVCAMSAEAEKLLGIEEAAAVNRHVADFLVPADANTPSAENLLGLLIEAVPGSGEPRSAMVRPRDEFGVRFSARVGRCGPPLAALLVITP